MKSVPKSAMPTSSTGPWAGPSPSSGYQEDAGDGEGKFAGSLHSPIVPEKADSCPCPHRRRRPPLRADAHAGQRRRRDRRASAPRPRSGQAATSSPTRATTPTLCAARSVRPEPCRSSPAGITRKKRSATTATRYNDRHLIENAFCRLKDFRRVATRYDKLAANFLSAVALAALARLLAVKSLDPSAQRASAEP